MYALPAGLSTKNSLLMSGTRLVRKNCGASSFDSIAFSHCMIRTFRARKPPSLILIYRCAEPLCHEKLNRYAKIGEVEVPVPSYRGFHVRPSTLIAKIVLHYGSDVQMELDGEIYDASSPLGLFRANEKINAQKRRWLAEEIVRLKLDRKQDNQSDFNNIIRELVLTLAGRSKLILYEHPLPLPEN